MTDKNDTSIAVGLGIWVCFCILISLWIFTRFLKGKQQLFTNLHVVEDSLRKMQEKLDLDLRKKSMGCVETLDDITGGCFSSEDVQEKTQTGRGDAEEEGSRLLSTENEVSKLNKEPTDSAEESLEDKKNI